MGKRNGKYPDTKAGKTAEAMERRYESLKNDPDKADLALMSFEAAKATALEKEYGEYFDHPSVHVSQFAHDPVCIYIDSQIAPDDDLPITKNLGSDIGNDVIMPLGCGFIDENNYPGLGEYLRMKGLAEPYKRFGEQVYKSSGFCEYPLYEFNMKELAKYAPDDQIKAYIDQYPSAFEKARQRMFGDFEEDDDDEYETEFDEQELEDDLPF